MSFNDQFPDFEEASPQDVLRWASAEFGENFAVVTSFQPTGIVTLHMLQDIAPQTPILTLDTGLLFDETYALMDEIEARFDLHIQRIQPVQTVDEQAQEHGDALWERDANQCCYLRKVLPLKNALKGYSAWATGLRRDQSPLRAKVPIVSWDKQHELVKIAPFATWTEDMIWLYMNTYDLPYNKLHDQGYPSIGCWPCTNPVQEGQDTRAGRWAGTRKTECGIHFSSIGAGVMG
jgi:phosphoadenosine phosphosulfate reductase